MIYNPTLIILRFKCVQRGLEVMVDYGRAPDRLVYCPLISSPSFILPTCSYPKVLAAIAIQQTTNMTYSLYLLPKSYSILIHPTEPGCLRATSDSTELEVQERRSKILGARVNIDAARTESLCKMYHDGRRIFYDS